MEAGDVEARILEVHRRIERAPNPSEPPAVTEQELGRPRCKAGAQGVALSVRHFPEPVPLESHKPAEDRAEVCAVTPRRQGDPAVAPVEAVAVDVRLGRRPLKAPPVHPRAHPTVKHVVAASIVKAGAARPDARRVDELVRATPTDDVDGNASTLPSHHRPIGSAPQVQANFSRLVRVKGPAVVRGDRRAWRLPVPLGNGHLHVAVRPVLDFRELVHVGGVDIHLLGDEAVVRVGCFGQLVAAGLQTPGDPLPGGPVRVRWESPHGGLDHLVGQLALDDRRHRIPRPSVQLRQELAVHFPPVEGEPHDTGIALAETDLNRAHPPQHPHHEPVEIDERLVAVFGNRSPGATRTPRKAGPTPLPQVTILIPDHHVHQSGFQERRGIDPITR